MEILKNKEGELSHVKEEAAEVSSKIQTAKIAVPDVFTERGKRMRTTFISDSVKELLVMQLAHELYNYNLYKVFSAYFHTNDLPKLGIYFEGRAEEELKHSNWVYNYLVDTGAKFTYPSIPAVKVDIKNHLTPFELTVDQEIDTTLKIEQIINQAIKEGDWITFSILTGKDDKYGMLMVEQLEEMNLSNTVLSLAQEEGSWLKKQETILRFYRNPESEIIND